MDPEALKREKAKVIAEMRKLQAAAEARDDKRYTEQEATKWDEFRSEIDRLNKEIERAEFIESQNVSGASNDNDDNHDNYNGSDGETRFADFGDYLTAVMRSSAPGASVDNRLQRASSGQGETNPALGGFLVQTDHQSELLKRVYQMAILAAACRKTPIGANSNALSWNQVEETSRATGSRMGGIRGYWASEADTVTGSKMKVSQQELKLQKLMGIMYATEELIADTTALSALMFETMGDELAWLLDEAIFAGTGAGQPLGIINSDAFVSVSAESGQAAATIAYENIVKMRARVWSPSMGRGNWYINQDCLPQLDTMAFVVGTGGVPVYMPAGGVSSTPYGSLMGRPVVPIEHAKTCGTVGDIVFADLSQYRLIDKNGLKNDVSIHIRFLYDETAFRVVYRVNGQPLWTSALTPANGTDTLSPFVGLATRS